MTSGTAGSLPGSGRRVASKRARMVVRRRARGAGGPSAAEEWRVPSLTPATPPAAELEAPEAPEAEPAREAEEHVPHIDRRVQVRRARQRIIAAMGLLVMAGGVLGAVGWDQVRGSTAGRYVDPSLTPDQPGYAAFVTSTPTLLVVYEGADAELAGASLLSLQADDEGGSVLVMPAATLAHFGSLSVTFAQAYEDDGVDGVKGLVESVLEVAVNETVHVDEERWETLVEPVAPLSVELDSPVDDWPSGEVPLSAAEIGPFLAARNEGESELNRTSRQETFWRAWLDAIGTGGEDAVPGELDSGLGRFVRGLARGADVESLPATMTLAVGSPTEVYDPDEDLVAELVARSIPFPRSPAPGVRDRVRLLNGTDDADLPARAAELLVAAGAEITISGNASSFDEPSTRIIYSDPTMEDEAESYQAKLGIGVIEEEPTSEDAPLVDESERIDLTVILGADALEAMQEVGEAG